MNRQVLDKLAGYLAAKTDPTEQEKELLAQLKEAMTDFGIAFIDKWIIGRNGFIANDLSDDDMEELAGKIGDYVCGSEQFDYAIEQACRDMGLEPIPNCPLCGDSTTYDPLAQTYTCNFCGQEWHQNRYVLVEDPKETDRLPDDLGYPSAEAQNSNARYITEYDYLCIFQKAPDADSYFVPVDWPDSQKYMPAEGVDRENNDDSIQALTEPINDEKGMEDFGPNAYWVPLCNLKNQDER